MTHHCISQGDAPVYDSRYNRCDVDKHVAGIGLASTNLNWKICHEH